MFIALIHRKLLISNGKSNSRKGPNFAVSNRHKLDKKTAKFILFRPESPLFDTILRKMTNKGISEIDPNLPKMDCSLFGVSTVHKNHYFRTGIFRHFQQQPTHSKNKSV